jgi:hypothetical protein
MVGVTFEVCFVCLVGLEINLRVLKHSERVFEPAGYLLVDEI